MIVVADTSPLIVLCKIGHLELLRDLFGEVLIPPQVANELVSPGGPAVIRAAFGKWPAWLIVKTPSRAELIPDLDAGESAAITLASEIHADTLLIDERLGRVEALKRKLHVTGTIGVLILAAEQGTIDLPAAFTAVKQTDFRVSNAFLDEQLELFRNRGKSR